MKLIIPPYQCGMCSLAFFYPHDIYPTWDGQGWIVSLRCENCNFEWSASTQIIDEEIHVG